MSKCDNPLHCYLTFVLFTFPVEWFSFFLKQAYHWRYWAYDHGQYLRRAGRWWMKQQEEKQFSWAHHKAWNERQWDFIQGSCVYMWGSVWDRINTEALLTRKEAMGSEAPESGNTCSWTLDGAVGLGSLAALGCLRHQGRHSPKRHLYIACCSSVHSSLCGEWMWLCSPQSNIFHEEQRF